MTQDNRRHELVDIIKPLIVNYLTDDVKDAYWLESKIVDAVIAREKKMLEEILREAEGTGCAYCERIVDTINKYKGE